MAAMTLIRAEMCRHLMVEHTGSLVQGQSMVWYGEVYSMTHDS